MPNVVFRPRVSERSPSRTWFAELATAPGPQVIGVTGDNSFDTLFGREWLLEWSVEDDHLRLYQESAAHPGEWERVTADLPPVFDSPLPASARRVTFCFDQSARIIVAYEDEGVIKVTRWDAGSGQYVQNVSFTGHDPAVVMDATWAHDIPNSDVLLFYLSTDRTKVLCRVQRELYADEHELWDYGQQVILDRALPAFLRYQLLLADSAGAPLEKVLLSDLYPYLGTDPLSVEMRLTGAGDYQQVVIPAAFSESVAAALALTGAGQYGPAVLEVAGVESVSASMTLTGSGAYVPVIINAETLEVLEAATTLTGAGDYVQVVISHSDSNDALTVVMTIGNGGTYGPP